MQRARFGPEKIALVPVLFFFFGSIPAAASSPALSWLVLLPLAAGVWVLRAKVVVDADRLVVCNGLRSRPYPWAEVTGVDLQPRRPVQLLLTGDRRVVMAALPRRDVRRLLELAPATPEPGNSGTPAPGNSGTPAPGNSGTPAPGNSGTPAPGQGGRT